MQIQAFVLTATLVLLFGLGLANGWFWEGDEHKDRELDGSLRCYQCNSSNDWQKVCHLGKWKHANITEKRNMTMQCPRRKSAFCHLVLAQDGREQTVRGCSGPAHDDGRKAKRGCFKMVGTNPDLVDRVCLCDTDLCNRASWPPLASPALTVVLAALLMLR